MTRKLITRENLVCVQLTNNNGTNAALTIKEKNLVASLKLDKTIATHVKQVWHPLVEYRKANTETIISTMTNVHI